MQWEVCAIPLGPLPACRMLAQLGKRFETCYCLSDGRVFSSRAYRPLGPIARMFVLRMTVSGMREMQ